MASGILGQSAPSATTNTSVYSNKSREFVALALVPDGLQHLIRFFTHVFKASTTALFVIGN